MRTFVGLLVIIVLAVMSSNSKAAPASAPSASESRIQLFLPEAQPSEGASYSFVIEVMNDSKETLLIAPFVDGDIVEVPPPGMKMADVPQNPIVDRTDDICHACIALTVPVVIGAEHLTALGKINLVEGHGRISIPSGKSALFKVTLPPRALMRGECSITLSLKKRGVVVAEAKRVSVHCAAASELPSQR